MDLSVILIITMCRSTGSLTDFSSTQTTTEYGYTGYIPSLSLEKDAQTWDKSQRSSPFTGGIQRAMWNVCRSNPPDDVAKTANQDPRIGQMHR
jgi:hypothetical protein